MNYTLFLQAFRQKYKDIKGAQILFQYLREELQYLVLYMIYSKTRYPVYFMGGTKLRLSYGINRFSEDIDFTLDKPDQNFPAEQFFSDIQNAFSKKVMGFLLNGKLSTKRNVIKVTLSFSKILFDIGISPLPSETIKIKIEVDINPPAHAKMEKKTYHSFAGDYMVNTHDLETGFAGKIAAVLLPEYQKGRDYYDLQWYLQSRKQIHMNLDYLNAGIVQQGGKEFKNEKNAISAVEKKVKGLDLSLLKSDLERFIMMDKKSFEEWVKNYISETAALLETYKNAL